MKKIPHIRFGIMLVIFLIQSCSTVVVATPTLEHSSPVAPTPTLEQPSPVPVTLTLTSTAEILAPTPSFEPPEGFKEYQDALVGVSVFIPESWVAIEVDPGQLAYLQSYPEDKYIGGEAFQSGDTKCDFYIRPLGSNLDELIQEWKSGPFTTVISEDEVILRDGQPGTRIEIESMGYSVSVFTEINERVIVLACFGELEPFDDIAVTLSGFEVAFPPPPTDSDAGIKQYQDSETGVAVSVPGNWVISGIIPGHRATLQSYPEGKYIGGEVIQPGDTKCDLFIRPPDISVVDFVQEMKSNDTITIVSEDEIALQSGQTGTRLEVESMGRSISLVTEINARVVVLNCFGELAPFDEIAVTLNASK